jgi:hypothetical protein
MTKLKYGNGNDISVTDNNTNDTMTLGTECRSLRK